MTAATSVAQAQDAELPGRNAAASDAMPTIVPVEDAGGRSVFGLVNDGFDAAVGAIESVLFYKIGHIKQPTLTYRRAEPFVRTAGTQDPFRPLRQLDADLPDELSLVDLSRLALQGRLLEGTPSEPKLGRIGQGGVDYVVVSVPYEGAGLTIPHGTVYIGETAGDASGPAAVGLWRRQVGLRDRVSQTEVLTAAAGRALIDDGLATVGTREVGGIPFIVAWLAFGAVFFTIRMRGVNVWAFGHAIQVVRGKYDDPDEDGEVTHAQALASALSATVGLGNIAGVTVAMTLGGPGAFFWMLFCGAFGMASKFVECTLAQKYRDVDAGDGTVLGGPMRYLRVGLAEKNWPVAGRVLAWLFAAMCVLASFGGGNMFQANQSAAAVVKVVQQATMDRLETIDDEMLEAAAAEDGVLYTRLRDERAELNDSLATKQTVVAVVYGVVLAAAVTLVIVGGIKRIGATAAKIVPAMCGLYLAACLWIIATHLTDVPGLVVSIFTEAFSGRALGGGFVGAVTVAVVGLTRAAFSNEAGVGSAAIAHSAAKTDEPVREGCVALLGPFIDTIVVCSMTALVILITGAWDNAEWIEGRGLAGSALTSQAFGSEISWFPYVLAVATVLFAFSTIISWSYYGEKATQYLFGRRAVPAYKAVTIGCVVLGAIVNLGAVLSFSDMMILCMAVPNILGALFLSGDVWTDAVDYFGRLRSGAFDDTTIAPADPENARS